MSPTRLAILTACLLLSAAAGAAGGVVHLYLQPLPPDAARLSFTIGSVAAIGADGVTHALQLNLPSVNRSEAARQRLLASGRLPAGNYVGFLVDIKKAGLTSEQGDAALVVPDAPVRLDFEFSATSLEAPLVWASLSYPASISGGFRFDPVISLVSPSKPLPARAGFVTNSRSDTITVFDKQLGQAVAAIEPCAGPAGMALDRRLRRLYVACARGDELLSIDIATVTVVDRIPASPGDRPQEVALTPDGTTLIAVNTGSGSVSFFDARSLARLERLTVGAGPSSILVDDRGRRAFVFNTQSSSVSVIDVPGRSLVGTVSVDQAPRRGQFNGRGDRIFVIHDRSPFLTVIDPSQLGVVTRARLSIDAEAIALDRVRNLLCLAGSRETILGLYDPHALLPVYSVKVGSGISYLAIDTEDNTVYMVSPAARRVMAGRLPDRKVVATIDVGDGAYGVSVMGEK